MPGNYADTSNIVDAQQIDAADVKVPIDALDDQLKTEHDLVAAIIAAPVITASATAAFSGETTLATALASPPAIGGTTPAAGTFSSLAYSGAVATNRLLSWQTSGSFRWAGGANSAAEGGANAGSDFILARYSDAGAFIATVLTITRSTGNATFANNLTVTGTMAKGGGSFEIAHPLDPSGTMLVHSFIEGPRADLIYRGRVTLVKGRAEIDLDAASGMRPGTFEALTFAAEADAFLQNQTGFTALRYDLNGALLTIIASDDGCTDTVSWQVNAERADAVIKQWARTNEEGRLQTEWPMTEGERKRYAEAYEEHKDSADPAMQGVKEIYRRIAQEKPETIARIQQERAAKLAALSEEDAQIGNDDAGTKGGSLQAGRG